MQAKTLKCGSIDCSRNALIPHPLLSHPSDIHLICSLKQHTDASGHVVAYREGWCTFQALHRPKEVGRRCYSRDRSIPTKSSAAAGCINIGWASTLSITHRSTSQTSLCSCQKASCCSTSVGRLAAIRHAEQISELCIQRFAFRHLKARRRYNTTCRHHGWSGFNKHLSV